MTDQMLPKPENSDDPKTLTNSQTSFKTPQKSRNYTMSGKHKYSQSVNNNDYNGQSNKNQNSVTHNSQRKSTISKPAASPDTTPDKKHPMTPEKVKKFNVNSTRYRSLNFAGSGAFAKVYHVVSSSNSHYALKKYIKTKKISLLSANNEIQYLSTLKHPNIIEMIDFEKKKNKFTSKTNSIIIIFDYCEGNLINFVKSHLDKSMIFPEVHIKNVLLDITDAVGYLHHLDPPLVHRDIKLDNVLIKGNSYILCDFGSCTVSPIELAKSNWEEINYDITNFTTPCYRCPEMLQIFSYRVINTKADIWTIGCMLYLMCFYKTPFNENVNSIVNGIFKFPPSSIPMEFLYLICLCFKVNPELRPDIFQLSNLIAKYSKAECRVSNHLSSQELDFPVNLVPQMFTQIGHTSRSGMHKRTYSNVPNPIPAASPYLGPNKPSYSELSQNRRKAEFSDDDDSTDTAQPSKSAIKVKSNHAKSLSFAPNNVDDALSSMRITSTVDNDPTSDKSETNPGSTTELLQSDQHSENKSKSASSFNHIKMSQFKHKKSSSMFKINPPPPIPENDKE